MTDPTPRVYLVCRTDLELSPGKLAAQIFHAGTGLLAALPAETRLEKARAAAAAADLPHHLQIDGGLTEIPADTPTVLAFGPVRRDDLPKALQRLQAL